MLFSLIGLVPPWVHVRIDDPTVRIPVGYSFITIGVPIQVDEATSEADKDSAKEVKLNLTASEDAAPYSGPIRLVANDNKQRSYVAIPLSLASERQHEIWLTVTPPEKDPEKEPGNDAE